MRENSLVVEADLADEGRSAKGQQGEGAGRRAGRRRSRSRILVLVGVGRDDDAATASSMAEKIANLRIFSDDQGKMNRSLLDTKGAALVVSQFTLYGDAQGQRRPSFVHAAPAELGRALYESFVAALRALGVPVETGVFQADMSVELVNKGPVTILLDSDKTF